MDAEGIEPSTCRLRVVALRVSTVLPCLTFECIPVSIHAACSAVLQKPRYPRLPSLSLQGTHKSPHSPHSRSARKNCTRDIATRAVHRFDRILQCAILKMWALLRGGSNLSAARPFFRRSPPGGICGTRRYTIRNRIHRLNAIDSQNQAKKWQGMAGTGYTSFNRMFSGTLVLAPLCH